MNTALLLFGLSFTAWSTCITKSQEVVLPARSYTITKIDSINNHYIISSKFDLDIYKVVTTKPKRYQRNCRLIKINKTYILKLKPYLHQFKFVDLSEAHVGTIGLQDGTSVPVEDNCIKDVFFTDDISGICLLIKQ
jgi:hypothetical protein